MNRRERQHEAGSPGLRHLQANLPTDMLDHALDDGQAQPHPFLPGGIAAMDEAFE